MKLCFNLYVHCKFLLKTAIFVILINIAHALRYDEQQNAHTAFCAQCQLVKLTQQREHERESARERINKRQKLHESDVCACVCLCVGVPKGRTVTSFAAASATASIH